MKKFLIVLLIICFTILAILLYKDYSNSEIDKGPSIESTVNNDQDLEMKRINEEAKSKESNAIVINESKSIVGNIKIDNLSIDYPIMYADNNEYYLKHNSNGELDNNGAIFLDANSNGKWSKLNLIHGHNMNSGKMFGNLDKYKNKSFCLDNLYINVTQDNVDYLYKVFSVFTYDANKEQIPISFSDLTEYESYFKELSSRSKFKLDIPGRYSTVIMLSTCSYNYKGEHLLVCAYRE